MDWKSFLKKEVVIKVRKNSKTFNGKVVEVFDLGDDLILIVILHENRLSIFSNREISEIKEK